MLGAGLTTVATGGTLGGYGIVPGTVSNSGTIAVGSALQAFALGNTGSLRIGGDLSNSGVINLAAASGQVGNVLNVAGNYTGQKGQVTLNAVLNAGGIASQADQLVVAGNASGTTLIKVVRVAGTGAATVGDGIRLIQVKGTSAVNSFRLASAVQAGAYQYLMYQGGAASTNDWYLRSELDPTATGATMIDTNGATSGPIAYRPGVVGYSITPQLNADYGFAALGRLQERVGDVASLDVAQPANSNGIWGRLDGQNLDADAGQRFSADEHTFLAQFGKDWTLARGTDGGSTHAGATLTFGSTSASFNDSARSNAGLSDSMGTVETQAQTIGGYWTKYLPDGSYFDGVGQLTHYQNRYSDATGVGGSQNGFGTALSGEVGKPFSLGSTGAAIEPQAQLIYQYLHLNHFDDGVSGIDADTTNGLRGRLGFRLFKANMTNDTKTSTLTPQFTVDVLHDFFSPGRTSVGGTSFEEEMGKTWYDVGVGVTGSFGTNSELYANVKYEHSMGGEYRRNVFGQVGYRYSW
ncbi:autotransporter outer membrane beta-barrel domain-containing protein [Pararobbsia alpina]|uniref:autotransporter family protein n=1 Tax=Pararobbsia alpina TaxID=621374 RepID=UPI0039A49434